jgi:hypothetical protein
MMPTASYFFKSGFFAAGAPGLPAAAGFGTGFGFASSFIRYNSTSPCLDGDIPACASIWRRMSGGASL